MTWQAILDGELREQALAAVLRIANDLADAVPQPGLSHGLAGLAVFHAYLERAGLIAPGRSLVYLERAFDGAGQATLLPALFGGFTGVAWAAAHLGHGDLATEIDDVLVHHLGDYQGGHDVTVGLVGFGTYGLERGPAGVPIVERVVDRLADRARWQGATCTWITEPAEFDPRLRPQYPDGYFDCGLAHGAAGIIAFLAATRRRIPRAGELLDGALRWLLEQRRPDAAGNQFPGWISARGRDERPWPAWCYGDAGVAVALRHAGSPIALEVARSAGERDVVLTDAGICHGTSGLGHILNRLHQASGDPVLGDLARRWFERTLAMRDEAGVGGFLLNVVSGEPPRIGPGRVHGILTGAAGVGLALLAAATDLEPSWDRFLLLAPVDTVDAT